MESWSGLYASRNEARKRYRSIWDVPLVKKETDRLYADIKDGMTVLEVGAGDRRFEAKIKSKRPGVVYRGMDIDRRTRQDYYSLDEITESFDFVFLFEVIEHLTPEDGLALLRKIHSLLKPGGSVLVGTPNLYHPHRYFGDVTHKTPYKYEELGGLMLTAGFHDLAFFRQYNEPFLKKTFRLSIGILLHKFLDIDFAVTILAEGTK